MIGSDSSRSAGAQSADPRSRQIIDGLPEGYVSFDGDWRLTDCNPVGEHLFGRARETLIGRRICDISGLEGDSPFAELAAKVSDTGAPEDAEVSHRSQHGVRLLSVRAFPLAGGVGVVWRDITLARAAERRLALSEARYREIADGMPAAAWLSRASGKLEFINQAMVDALGWPRKELLGDGWIRHIDPEDRPRLLAGRAYARRTHSSFHYEGHFRRPDGSLRIIQLFGRPRFDDTGAFHGHVGIATDLTDVREHEDQQQLLIDELNHRVKNTLATVQSLVRHTIRDHAADRGIEQDITERLVALSGAHNVLSRSHWQGAGLAEIVSQVLRPYDHAGRVSAAGPEARISPKVAIALAMGLQELATNAAKHGALSAPKGRVGVSWELGDGAVALEWRESGGPPVDAPGLTGFGSILLGRVLASELGEPAVVIHARDGLICRIHAPTLG